MWKEFPEINRKVAFSGYYNGIDGAYMGCHCGTLSSIHATFTSGYGTENGGKNIEVIDTSKEPAITYEKDRYNDFFVAPSEERRKIVAYLREKEITLPDIAEGIYEHIIDLCKSIPLWVMSDVINGKAPARRGPSLIYGGDMTFEQVGSTYDFAQYLIKNKIGYIMSSPIVQNPVHRFPDNYSLNQGWFWIHPKHLPRAIDVGATHREGVEFPTREKWLETITEDLTFKTDLPPTNGSLDDYILSRVFNEGVFPKEDPRFQSTPEEAPKLLRRKKIAVEA